jgi:hypothetical protein
MHDALYVLEYLYVPGSPQPPAPFPNCGSDPTEDEYDCESHYCFSWESPQIETAKRVGGKLLLGRPEMRDSEAVLPVYLHNTVDVSGFAYAILYDHSSMDAASVRIDGLITKRFDFFSAKPHGNQSKIAVGNVISLTMGKSLPPGEYHIADIVLEFGSGDTESTELVLTDVELVDTDANVLACETRGVTIDSWAHLRIPKAYALNQAFPNPFGAQTSIRFALPKKSHVSLKVYNAAGQLVNTLVNEAKNPGYYRVEWNGEGPAGTKVASGIYFYRITAEEYTATRKLVYVR